MHEYTARAATMIADAGHMDGFGWGMMAVAWISLIILVGAIIWFGARSASTTQNATSSALSILSDRYARGEIDDEEYRRRSDELRRRH